MQHLVFYDDRCVFCLRAVLYIIQHDSNALFNFSPLHGTTAKKYLAEPSYFLKDMPTLVLVENYQEKNLFFYIKICAVLRILKNLNTYWRFLGYLSHIPGISYLNFLYDAIARCRSNICANTSRLSIDLEPFKNRFFD